jgi:tetratricopeptide (TPR) repeat protein
MEGWNMTMGRWMRVLLCGGFALLLSVNCLAAASKKSEEKHYPNATRTEPKSDLSSPADQKALQAAIDAVNGGDDAKAQESAQKIIDSSKSKYAQGIALQVLANTKFNAGDYKGAIESYQKLLTLNSLPNDAYFDSWYNMINAYVGDEQYEKAGEELKKWREQSKSEKADSYALEGNIDYRLQKFPEAIAAIKKAQSMTNEPKESWNTILMAAYNESGQTGQANTVIDEQLAKNPNDKKLIQNALVIYSQANENDKAVKLLDRERSQGLIKY